MTTINGIPPSSDWPYDLGYKYVERYYDVNDFIFSASLPEILIYTIVSKDDRYYQIVSTIVYNTDGENICKDYVVNYEMLEVIPHKTNKTVWVGVV